MTESRLQLNLPCLQNMLRFQIKAIYSESLAATLSQEDVDDFFLPIQALRLPAVMSLPSFFKAEQVQCAVVFCRRLPRLQSLEGKRIHFQKDNRDHLLTCTEPRASPSLCLQCVKNKSPEALELSAVVAVFCRSLPFTCLMTYLDFWGGGSLQLNLAGLWILVLFLILDNTSF